MAMIKVEIYNNSYSWEEDEPDEVLTLKEFEDKFNSRLDDYSDFDPSYIRFIVK